MRWLFVVFIFISVGLLSQQIDGENRSFRIDYTNNCFLKDDEPFRFVAGSFHYFRALPQRWREKLRTLRAAGLNAVTTYVEWSLHNPHPDQYNWDGIANVEEFIRLAAEEDLLVILRPGPYICAERDMGGLPYWLLTKYPKIQLRTSDPDYLREVGIWYSKLMPRFEQYLYGNGGPIIMVQVENEYGYFGCDNQYSKWLRDETLKYVGDKTVLFTNDIVEERQIKCGKIENVLATVDFGIGTKSDFDGHWQMLRKYQPNGPLVNAEFYPGWFTHWHDKVPGTRDANQVADSLRLMLESGASVNFYMFFGGTNFGFTAGANKLGRGDYVVDVTSYDYDAPMDEAGDPTAKYHILRDVIKDFLPLPNVTVPEKARKMNLPSIQMRAKTTLFSQNSRNTLGGKVVTSKKPLKFEELNQFSGFVLYETKLPDRMLDPSVLQIPTLHDRAIVYVDNLFIGILSRETLANTLTISATAGGVLQILVENQGRINFEIANDFKGIIGDVLLNNNPLNNWNITGFSFENESKFNDLFTQIEQDPDGLNTIGNRSHEILFNGPVIFEGKFDIKQDEIYDTYIDPSGWGKGFIVVNSFNLGRYWPLVGPQIALYVPKEILRKSGNSIVIVELQNAPLNGELKFSNHPMFNTN